MPCRAHRATDALATIKFHAGTSMTAIHRPQAASIDRLQAGGITAAFWACWLCVHFLTTQPTMAGDQPKSTALFVAGYCDQVSYVAGESIGFHLSSNAAMAHMTIRRIGAEDKVVWEGQDIALENHHIPDRASSDGCQWPPTMRLTLPADWLSGYYEATVSVTGPLTSQESSATEIDSAEPAPETAAATIFFVVRSAHPGTDAKILLQLSTNTYNAYTNWGGHSLYAYHDRDGLQGHRVSFNRPQISQFGYWEIHFVRWAEANGYRLDFAANSDLEFHPEILTHYRLVLSVGHDEYWSSPMRDNLEAFICAGGNVAFFSGNTCCWQVRSEENGRALTCWKQAYVLDPLFRRGDAKLLSTAWSHHLIGRPENQLTGVGFLWGGYHLSHGEFMDGLGSYEVHRPDHWIFAGTNLKRGDRFGGKDTIVGYECDGCGLRWQDGMPYPTTKDGTPESFTILGTCPAKWAPDDCYWYDQFPQDRVGAAVMGTYTRNGTVFTCGSTDWAHGLAGHDPIVERITRNILERLSR